MYNPVDKIRYKDHPHFTVGKVTQWRESGYLFYNNKVYEYIDDRSGNYQEVNNPRNKDAFRSHAIANKIEVPSFFLELIC